MLNQKTTQSKETISKISSKGQVTIPVDIRRYLGVTSNDKVAFVIKVTGEVELTQASYPNISSLQGAAGSLKKPLKWKQIKQIANEDRLKKKYEE